MSDGKKMQTFFQNEKNGEGVLSKYPLRGENDSQNRANGPNYSSMNDYNVNMPAAVSSQTRGICSNLQDSNGGSDRAERSPLGLKLTISPSFVSMVEARLSGNRRNQDSNSNRHKRSRIDDPAPDKLKASNFPMASIVIGQWQRYSMHEGDLTAKVYYSKRKIVWEILDGALKSKMEILWSEISALRVTMKSNKQAVLEIELEGPPLFYREANPMPRKHTIWHQASDFTGGQATYWRKHSVRFSPGVFDRHYEKLLQCDHRLAKLSLEPFPSEGSPYFNTTIANYYMLPSISNGIDNSQRLHSTTTPELAPSSSFSPLITNPYVTNPSGTNGAEMINFQVPAFWNNEATNFPINNIDNTQGVGVGPKQSANEQDNQAYNPYNYHPITITSLTDIERHLFGDSQTVPLEDDGTLKAQVDTMCSMLEHDSTVHQPQVVTGPNHAQNPTQDLCPTQSINWADESLEMISMDNIIDSLKFDFSDLWE